MNYTKAAGRVSGVGRDITIFNSIPPKWRNLFSGVFSSKLHSCSEGAEDINHFNLSLSEKETDIMLCNKSSKEAVFAARNHGKKLSPRSVDLKLTPNSSVVSTLSKPSGDAHKSQKLYHLQTYP